MAHYAFLDSENVVAQVITGRDEGENNWSGEQWEVHYAETSGRPCKRTSYNTRGGQHTLGGVQFRKNYAGIGYTYDAARDAFIPPQPGPDWTLDEDACLWVAPPEE